MLAVDNLKLNSMFIIEKLFEVLDDKLRVGFA